jgi:hypothetical protein
LIDPHRPWGIYAYYPSAVCPKLIDQCHDRGLAENEVRFYRRALPNFKFEIVNLADYTKAPAA